MAKVSAKNKNRAELNISIRSANFIGLEILANGQGLNSEIPFGGFGYTLQYKISVDSENRIVHIIVMVTVSAREEDLEYCAITADFTIYIDNISDILTPSEKGQSPELLDAAAKIVLGICTSTTRGMFIMAVKDTPFKNAIIPIINPQGLIKIED